MIRTQVYFDPEDMRMIEYLAAREGVKKARMMRMVVKAGIKLRMKKKMPEMKNLTDTFKALGEIGGKGPRDLSENMADYLYGDKSDYAVSENSG